MINLNNWTKLFVIVSLVYLIALGFASYSMSIPLGTDVWFHFDVAQEYASGQFGMFGETVMELNRFPYPPVFHLLLVPAVLVGQQAVFGRVMQTVLPFLIFLCSCLFVRKHFGDKACLLTGLVLVGSVGFTDGTIQCRPQGLAMLLLPFLFDGLITSDSKKQVISNVVIGYTHGVAGLASSWLPSLYSLFVDKKIRKSLLVTIALLIPLVIVTFLFFGGATSKWGGHFDTYQEYLIFSDPLGMIPYYAGVSLIGWFFVVYTLFKWSDAGLFDRILSLSLLGLVIMVPFWADRFLQYSMIGLACLTGVGLTRNRTLFYTFVPVLAIMAFFGLLNLFWITLTGNWWLYPPA